MEESLSRQFKRDRHRGMLTQGHETMLQIKEVIGIELQFNQGWLSVITVKRKAILLDNAQNQKGLRIRHDNGDTVIAMIYLQLRQFPWPVYLPVTQTFFK
ncbi:hypothetical protein Tco_0061552, partial [Tanacetum coccineum]